MILVLVLLVVVVGAGCMRSERSMRMYDVCPCDAGDALFAGADGPAGGGQEDQPAGMNAKLAHMHIHRGRVMWTSY